MSDLIVLHEQSCFEATENRQLLKMLRQKNASLNAEVSCLFVGLNYCFTKSASLNRQRLQQYTPLL